jgi:pimeloyl-ACP methyl ester carboxylesterase
MTMLDRSKVRQSRSHSPTQRAAQAARLVGAAALASPLGWIGYSALAIDHQVPLPPAIDSIRRVFRSGMAGALSYYVDRSVSGRPLVLLHSINAGPSAMEVRPLFEYYRGKRPVFALDLPGFGFSERRDRSYSPMLFSAAIADLITSEVHGEAVDIVALSLSAEFAARVALDRPELVHSLALISPSGFAIGGKNNSGERASSNGTADRLYRAFTFPLWSQPFYDLLASRPSIRYYLKKSFVGPVDETLVEYAYRTTHQPGARHAPLYFISGKLFSPEIRAAVYSRLQQPVLVVYDQDPYVRFDALPAFIAEHRNWQAARIIPTRGLPHFEQLPKTTQALDHFWGAADST